MSPIGLENFQRLEEFPSFISCIKCFHKPIIPPLLTASRRQEMKQLRVAAANKEAEIQRKKQLLRQRQDIQGTSKVHKNNCRSDYQPNMHDCALWYPSSKDNQEGISIAISKFPTNEIYSSVHTGAIVCSNVIENSHTYAARIRNSLFGSEGNGIDCVECSHNNFNLLCSLCQAEYNQSFHNRSFTSEISPEVPCRTFSLLQQNASVTDAESNSAVEETECESLPTVICNQKCIPPDTDSESNTTYMSQSTDLEKYMECSCEFNSPDNSGVAWDSKSISQQYTLSRSDDASSETIVNTENELTPCASTMAEFTDNIEDELSNADETACVHENKEVTIGTLKRAHSVDSYMKILQTARSLNVKKSLSEPFNTNQQASCSIEGTQIPVSSKAGLLIKEDSKESEESKDLPEKDIYLQESKEISVEDDKTLELDSDNSHAFQKKHIRQNSYTLDHPSSALILAHADCTCNFDAECISPHCSALKDESAVGSSFAFTKEKVEVDIPVSYHQVKKLLPFSSENYSADIILNKDDAAPTVIDVFPAIKEDNCEKSDSGNSKVSESVTVSENRSTIEAQRDSECDKEEHLSEMFSENLFISNEKKHKDYVECIYKKLQETHKMHVKELCEEQNRQWLKLQEQLKQEEEQLFEKLKLTLLSTSSSSKSEEKIQSENSANCNDEKSGEDKSVPQKQELPLSNSSKVTYDQVSSSENFSMQTVSLNVPSENPQIVCSPSKTLILPENARASISPSKEYKSPINSPSIPLENIKSKQLFKDSDMSTAYNFKSDEEDVYSICESMPSVNGFSSPASSLLPHTNNPPKSSNTVVASVDKKCDKMPTCFCDNCKECKCCTSFNGYCEYDINTSHPNCASHSKIQNVVSNDKFSNCHYDLPSSENCLSSSSIQSKNLNSNDFINCQSFNDSRKPISSFSKKSGNYVSDIKNAVSAASLSYDIVKLPNAMCNKDTRKSLSHSYEEKCKLPVDSIVSLCNNKSLKNGTLIPQVATLNKRVIDPVLKKKLEKLPAFVKGYLTRRLFKTERVQSLVKTLRDTALLIGKLSEDLPMKGDPVSQRDVDFHRQLIVQLMTTFHNVYDIFCTISTKERMSIIAESRNFRLREKRMQQNQELSLPVTTKAADPAPFKKHKLSSATLKALERKKRSPIDSRTYSVEELKKARSRSVIDMGTYTIDDLPTFKGRSCSSMSFKNVCASPSSIYNQSVGVPLKRKTASAKSSESRHCLHHKWVP